MKLARRTVKRGRVEIIPMIDTILILLIFYMSFSSFRSSSSSFRSLGEMFEARRALSFELTLFSLPKLAEALLMVHMPKPILLVIPLMLLIT